MNCLLRVFLCPLWWGWLVVQSDELLSFGSQSFVRSMCCQSFLPSCDWPFPSFFFFFTWFLSRSGCFNFDEFQCVHIFLLSLVLYYILFNKSLPTEKSWTLSPRNFIAAAFTFRSETHLEFIFVHVHISLSNPSDCSLGLMAGIALMPRCLSYVTPGGCVEKHRWVMAHMRVFHWVRALCRKVAYLYVFTTWCESPFLHFDSLWIIIW